MMVRSFNSSLLTRRTTLKELGFYLEGLLELCERESVIFFKTGLYTLQFVNVSECNIHGLDFSFPDAGWSRDYFDLIRRSFSSEGIEYVVRPLEDGEIPRFLDVGNLDLATAKKVTLIAMNALPPCEDDLEVEYKGSWLRRPSRKYLRSRFLAMSLELQDQGSL